ncbi:MAG: cobalamin-dependent protein, partial [Deltaproteobacteria bacterium]|nr:cobalamin-dependent protein [Deltaproteobacteria bacterium]
MTTIYKPRHAVRIVTATSLFDGHDAAINIMRRLLQAAGVEVIHLGHNRSVREIVEAAIQEDVQGIAVSSYQGGHLEFFQYMVDLLKEKGAAHIRVFGGGGGVIVPDEIRQLQDYGVERIYSPEDGATQGLQGIINDLVQRCDFSTADLGVPAELQSLEPGQKQLIARLITVVEVATAGSDGHLAALRQQIQQLLPARKSPVVGITGTGGSGKSSLTDELILRFLHDFKEKT